MVDLEHCVSRVRVKKIGDETWMLLKNDHDAACYACDSHGEVKINYCKNRRVYFEYLKEEKKVQNEKKD